MPRLVKITINIGDVKNYKTREKCQMSTKSKREAFKFFYEDKARIPYRKCTFVGDVTF